MDYGGRGAGGRGEEAKCLPDPMAQGEAHSSASIALRAERQEKGPLNILMCLLAHPYESEKYSGFN